MIKVLSILCTATALTASLSYWRYQGNVREPAAPLTIVNDRGEVVSDLFLRAPKLPHAVAQDSKSRPACSASKSSPTFLERIESLLGVQAVSAQGCWQTPCGGSHLASNWEDCCPGGGGLRIFYDFDPWVAGPNAGVQSSYFLQCAHSFEVCPASCRPEGCWSEGE
jgi:hypothetical protein